MEQKQTGNASTTDTGSLQIESTVVEQPLTSVDAIKGAFSSIHQKLQKGKLDSLSIKYDCDGERSGTVTYYNEAGQLKLIKHSYSEYSHFSAEDYYYVNKDSVFFMYAKETVWSFESGQAAEGATKDDIIEKRSYISQSKPILCLEKKYTYRSKATNNQHPDQVANKEVECKTIEPIMLDYGKLLAFKDSKKQDCLGQ